VSKHWRLVLLLRDVPHVEELPMTGYQFDFTSEDAAHAEGIEMVRTSPHVAWYRVEVVE
jgi:hypothetical protein